MSSNFGFKASESEKYYFVSYNTEDAERIAQICKILDSQGVSLWYDEGIPHNAYWESLLAEKIDKSIEVIFFITKTIFEKGKNREPSEIYTYREYDLAKRYKKNMLIVLLDEIRNEDVPYPLMFWWQEIDPTIRQSIISYNDSSETVANKIFKELGLNNKKQSVGDQTALFAFKTRNDFFSKNGSTGPDRKMFTMESPATYPTINSISNNPTIGDEKYFVLMGEINKEKTQLSSGSIFLKPNSRYLVYVYCHNACSSSFFDETKKYSGVATGVRLSCSFPNHIQPSKSGIVSAIILGDNTKPKSVWSTVTVCAKEPLKLVLENPAKIYNDWKTNKTFLPMELFSEKGTFLGTEKLNGIMFGEESHCIVSFVLRTEPELGNSTSIKDEIKKQAEFIKKRCGNS